MSVTQTMNVFFAELVRRRSENQTERRIKDFFYRVMNSTLTDKSVTVREYATNTIDFEDNASQTKLNEKAQVYVLYVFVYREKVMSHLEWYELWCSSQYVAEKEEKFTALEFFCSRIKFYIDKHQQHFVYVPPSPIDFFVPLLPEVFFTFKYLQGPLNEKYIKTFFAVDALLRRRGDIQNETDMMLYAEEVVEFLKAEQDLSDDLHGVDIYEYEANGDISLFDFASGPKNVYYQEARLAFHKATFLAIHFEIPKVFAQIFGQQSGVATVRLAELEVCRSYIEDQFGSFEREFDRSVYDRHRGLDSNNYYWYKMYREIVKWGQIPIVRQPSAIRLTLIKGLQRACVVVVNSLRQTSEAFPFDSVKWNNEPDYAYWAAPSTPLIEPPRTSQPFPYQKRDKWLRLQKRVNEIRRIQNPSEEEQRELQRIQQEQYNLEQVSLGQPQPKRLRF